jgi:short-subunit dehydrogenase
MHIVVTGASSGIGAALARELGQNADGSLTLVARRKEPMEALAREVAARCFVCPHDLSDDSRATAWIAEAEQRNGPIDVLINNAGVENTGFAHLSDPDEGVRLLRTNLLSPILIARHVLPAMVERGHGTIVNVASVAAFAAMPKHAWYGASKAAIASFSEVLHTEVARHGVHVVTVYPGPVATPMADSAYAAFGGRKGIVGLVPEGKPDELARLVRRAIEKKQARVVYPAFYQVARALPSLARWVGALVVGASLLVACGGGSSSPKGDAPPHPPDGGMCNPDPLLTNLTPLFNGNSVDMYDCPILTFTAKYAEPDAMVFKAIMYVESRFQYDSVGCTGNTGCCPQYGWSGNECGCLGAMQTGPSCGGSNTLGLLANHHPDLSTDPSSPDWANSCFNPMVNTELGVAGIAGNRMQVKQMFPGCTEDQYTMMAVGNFNNYGSTHSCTDYNMTYDNAVIDAYKMYSTAAGWPAHPY